MSQYRIHWQTLNSCASRFICLLLLTNCNPDTVSAVAEGCPHLPIKNKTKPFHQMRSYPQGYKFFYTCIDGYVRKAGTSSMTRCMDISGKHGRTLQWDNISGKISFVCIPDLKRKKTTKGNDTQKTDEIHSITIPIGLGSGAGVILLIAVTVGGALMLQKQCFSRWRSRQSLPALLMEHMRLHPREIQQPEQEQHMSSTMPLKTK